MSRYAMLEPERLTPPLRAGRAPFGFREAWIGEFAVRDEPIRRALLRRAIGEARAHLLTSKDLLLVLGTGVPELGRPRIRWRRATPMPGEAPLYVLTVVVYPKGALP
jgi:hypothetical protein